MKKCLATFNIQFREVPFLFGNIQSLKLTEVAVDDFAARCGTDLGASDWNVRATNYIAAAVRRRSLAPVR
jgi:hypothetical protein